MDKQVKTKGIVIRRIDLGEADQILTILTEDQGKIAILAKGARRLKSKFSGKLELLYETKLNYFQGRELAHLNEVESSVLINELDLDLKSRSLLFYMAEATNKLLAEAQESEKIYQLLKSALNHFQKDSSESVFYAYLIKLLTELGFMPDWSRCNETNNKLDLNKPYFLSAQDTSLTPHAHLSVSGVALSPTLIKWVNYSQKQEFDQLKCIKPTSQERDDIFSLLNSIMRTILNHPFKSEAFIKLI